MRNESCTMHCCAPISIGRGRYRRMSWRHVSRLRGVASTATPPSGWKDLENHGLSTGRGACSVCCAHPLCESKTSFAQVTEVRRYADIGSVNPNHRTAEHLRRVIHRRVTHYQQAEIGFRQESSSAEISNAGHLRQRNRKKFAGAMDGTPAINGESCDRQAISAGQLPPHTSADVLLDALYRAYITVFCLTPRSLQRNTSMRYLIWSAGTQANRIARLVSNRGRTLAGADRASRVQIHVANRDQ